MIFYLLLLNFICVYLILKSRELVLISNKYYYNIINNMYIYIVYKY
jgi:hypothetical protein